MDRVKLLGVAQAEREALGRTIQYTPPDRWDADSPCEGWRNRDVVGHLAGSEAVAAAVAGGEVPSELDEYAKSSRSSQPTLSGFNEFSVARRRDTAFRDVVVEWGGAADLLLSRASSVDEAEWAKRRVPWVVGEIPLRYLVQSRVSEWWLHGDDVRRGAGLEPRMEHWPIYAVNDLAIRALPWALGLSDVHFHGKVIGVELSGPGGGTWRYGLEPRQVPATDRAPDATIAGRGYPFALVAGRRARAEDYVDDGTLVTAGDHELAMTVLRHVRAFA
jgi:uncharacterized protein (TIGR03083 family)